MGNNLLYNYMVSGKNRKQTVQNTTYTNVKSSIIFYGSLFLLLTNVCIQFPERHRKEMYFIEIFNLGLMYMYVHLDTCKCRR